jgi:hypothetical protein
MADWQQDHAPFHNQGMNLAAPVDKLPDGQHRYLRNVRPGGDGQLHGRQGTKSLVSFVPEASAIHSIFRFDDTVDEPEHWVGLYQKHNRLAGAGTKLIAAQTDTETDLNSLGYTTVSDQHNPASADVEFSGDPLTWAVAHSDFSPRPFVFIGDSLKHRKYISSKQCWQVGVAHPNFEPIVTATASSGGVNGGPDMAATASPYLYRFVARADPVIVTGSRSNPGPATRPVNGWYVTDPANLPTPAPTNSAAAGTWLKVEVPEAHPDPQIGWIDVYRFGGSLPQWIYIGSCRNLAGDYVTDKFADVDIAAGQLLQFDNYQPFLTVAPAREGECTIVNNSGGATGDGLGATITITGAQSTLKPYDSTAAGNDEYDVPGNQLLVAGRTFTFRRSPDSATSVEVEEDADGVTGGIWTMPNPEVARYPLQRIFGPWGAGQAGEFIFAVGDTNRPGALYWTTGNRPESHSPAGVLDLTSSADPLMNGVIYDGTPYVFSANKMFRVFPSFGAASLFSAVEVPNGCGLFGKWAIAVGPKLWTVQRDGVYEFEPGSEPRNITDQALYPLFSHEGVTSLSVYTPDGLKDITISGPDFSQPDELRLSYCQDGFLYFDFIDRDANRRTLVYDTNPAKLQHRGGWVSIDDYTPAVHYHYGEGGESNREILLGCSDGRIRLYDGASDSDGETGITCHIRTSSRDQGNPRARYHYGDVELDYDSQCQSLTIKAGFDDFSYLSTLASGFVRKQGYRRSVLDIESGKGQYAFNIGLDLVWTQTDGLSKFNFWEPSYLVKPVLTRKRATDWSDDGYLGAKFVQGFILQADTLGQDRTVAIESDGGSVQQTFTVNHDGEYEVPYSFTTPFISHMLRAHPTDDDYWRIFNFRWIWEPAPELVKYWETQEGKWDFTGFWHHRDAYLGLLSSAAATLTVTVDGTDYTYTVPSTSGVYSRPYLVLQPMKGKYAKYKISEPTSGLRLFQKDCEIRAKSWGANTPYQILQPFGDLSRERGARI